MISPHSKRYFIFFNVNKYLAVPFVKLTRNGSRVGHLCFCLHRITLSEHSYRYTGLILLIASNLPCYLHFAFCSNVWSKSIVPPHPSHHKKCFRVYVILRAERGHFGALNYWRDLRLNWRAVGNIHIYIYYIYYIYMYYSIYIHYMYIYTYYDIYMIYVCMIYIYIYIYICICVYIYVYNVYIHIYIYTYI